MRITLLGTGISQGIPVIGCPCAACQSTDSEDKRLRCSALVETDSLHVVIDIGPDFRQQLLRTNTQRVDAILITHEHSDHVGGLDDVRPFNWILRGGMPLYAEERVLHALKERYPYAFAPEGERYPGAPILKLHPIDRRLSPFAIGNLTIKPIRVMHGPLPIVGYRIDNFAYITDCSHLPDNEIESLKGIDTLVINALRREPHPMHFSLGESLEAIRRINPQKAYLTHISHELGPAVNVKSELPRNVSLGYDELSFVVD